MRRTLPMLATLAAALGVLALGDVASADEHGGWNRGGGWMRVDDHGGRGEHGRGGPWGHGGERGRGPPPGWGHGPGRGERQPMPGYYPPPGARPYPSEGRIYEPPREYAPPQGRWLQRGGHLPPGVQAEIVPEPWRYRLRPPPRGYTWMRVGNAFLLMNPATGQIFDMIAD